MTVGEYESLRKALPCEMVPATKLVMDLRSVKDQAEIDCLIAAQRIAEKALTETLNFIQWGAQSGRSPPTSSIRCCPTAGRRCPLSPLWSAAPTAACPRRALGQAGAAGDFITMDFGCVKYGYCSDMTRTVAVGHVTEEMEKVYPHSAGSPAGGHRHGQGRRPRQGRPRGGGPRSSPTRATAPTSATASATVWAWRSMSSPGRLPPAPIPCLWGR